MSSHYHWEATHIIIFDMWQSQSRSCCLPCITGSPNNTYARGRHRSHISNGQEPHDFIDILCSQERLYRQHFRADTSATLILTIPATTTHQYGRDLEVLRLISTDSERRNFFLVFFDWPNAEYAHIHIHAHTRTHTHIRSADNPLLIRFRWALARLCRKPPFLSISTALVLDIAVAVQFRRPCYTFWYFSCVAISAHRILRNTLYARCSSFCTIFVLIRLVHKIANVRASNTFSSLICAWSVHTLHMKSVNSIHATMPFPWDQHRAKYSHTYC